MLEGVSEVFKYFQGSRLASVGLLAATTTLVVGPNYNRLIPHVPDDWSWLVWGVMIFTGVQCAWWLVSGVVSSLGNGVKAVGKVLAKPVRPDQLKKDDTLVLVMAGNQGGYFAPDHVERFDISLSEVAAELAAKRLIELGLMEHGFGGYHLTDPGKEFFVLHFQQRPS